MKKHKKSKRPAAKPRVNWESACIDLRIDLHNAEEKIDGLIHQNSSIRGYCQAIADAIGQELPGIDTTEGNLLVLVNKLIAELHDARTQGPHGLVEACSLHPGEDLVERIKEMSEAAANVKEAEGLLGVPPGTLVESLKALDDRITKAMALNEIILDDMKKTRAWLHAKHGETTFKAAQRVVLTLEVSPGAPSELKKAREIVQADGGETLVEALNKPIDFHVVVHQDKKGEIVGGRLITPNRRIKLGEIDFEVNKLGE